MKFMVIAGIYGGLGAFLWAGIYFGSKWIDKTLGVKPSPD